MVSRQEWRECALTKDLIVLLTYCIKFIFYLKVWVPPPLLTTTTTTSRAFYKSVHYLIWNRHDHLPLNINLRYRLVLMFLFKYIIKQLKLLSQDWMFVSSSEGVTWNPDTHMEPWSDVSQSGSFKRYLRYWVLLINIYHIIQTET